MKYLLYILMFSILLGCYSFKGGSVPDHLKSIRIATVTDNSGYGNPQYMQNMTNELFKEFREDGSFKIVDRGGDAKITVTISSIREEKFQVSQQELETERKITVTCKVEYFDAVKNKMIWTNDFKNTEIYDINASQQGIDRAINDALQKTVEDIVFQVVSGW
jgi:organic radical activating enzyme